MDTSHWQIGWRGASWWQTNSVHSPGFCSGLDDALCTWSPSSRVPSIYLRDTPNPALPKIDPHWLPVLDSVPRGPQLSLPSRAYSAPAQRPGRPAFSPHLASLSGWTEETHGCSQWSKSLWPKGALWGGLRSPGMACGGDGVRVETGCVSSREEEPRPGGSGGAVTCPRHPLPTRAPSQSRGRSKRERGRP